MCNVCFCRDNCLLFLIHYSFISQIKKKNNQEEEGIENKWINDIIVKKEKNLKPTIIWFLSAGYLYRELCCQNQCQMETKPPVKQICSIQVLDLKICRIYFH